MSSPNPRCTLDGKESLPRAAAQAIARRQGVAHAYRCGQCGGWHVARNRTVSKASARKKDLRRNAKDARNADPYS